MIEFTDVEFSYYPGQPVLQKIRVEIPTGLTLILGVNGSGKSTFMKLAAGIERPDQGVVEIHGVDLWKDEARARMDLAYVPEHPDVSPYATIEDVLRLVCDLRLEKQEAVVDALRRAGLDGLRRRSIRELSAGQRRRVLLAAAWIGLPPVILLDEPLESMDRAMREELLIWVDRSVDRGAGVLVTTHEIEPFVQKAARALAFQEGRCRLHASLPEDPEERTRLLESLSRGSAA